MTLADLRSVITFYNFAFDLIDVGWKCGAIKSARVLYRVDGCEVLLFRLEDIDSPGLISIVIH